MEKLTIKHLAPYLPYKLKYLIDGEIYELDGLDVNGDAFNADTGEIPFNIIEPILRPLSDLTEEIIVDGKVFLPVEFLQHWFDFSYLDFETLPLCTWNYEVIEKLFEWHFDVFGLINKKLAIDINKV